MAIDSLNSLLEFEAALVRYYELFNSYDRAMIKDAYNACQIAAFLRHPNFKFFFTKCAAIGIPLTILLKHELIYNNYCTDSSFLKSLFQKGRMAYLKRIDLPLQEEMQRRYQNEQKAKNSSDYLQICQGNFNRILELSKMGQFPGEALIGTNETLENIVVPTLCHYPYAYKFMEQYLNQAVLEGSLPPVSAMYIYSFSQTRKSVLYTKDIPDESTSFTLCYNLPFGKQSTDLVSVNRNRALKWIPSVSIFNKIRSELPKRGIHYQFGF